LERFPGVTINTSYLLVADMCNLTRQYLFIQ